MKWGQFVPGEGKPRDVVGYQDKNAMGTKRKLIKGHKYYRKQPNNDYILTIIYYAGCRETGMVRGFYSYT